MSQLLQQRHDDKESLKSLREEILSKKEGRQATTLPAYKEKAPGNILTTGSSYRYVEDYSTVMRSSRVALCSTMSASLHCWIIAANE